MMQWQIRERRAERCVCIIFQSAADICVKRAFLEDLASCTDGVNVGRLTLCGCLSEAL